MSSHPTSSSHVPGFNPSSHPISEPLVVGKKGKKHKRDDHDTDASGQPQKKKKKRQKRDLPNEPLPADNPSVVASEPVEAAPTKQKKSGKRNKGKQPATPQLTESPPPQQQQIDPNLTLLSEADSSVAALISALVAATAAGNSDPSIAQDVQGPMGNAIHLNPQMVLEQSHQFISYPFMPYGFGGLLDLPPNPMQTLCPTAAPSAPIHELAFASNDDVLRALQALDMSKITSLLKNVAEGTCSSEDPPAVHHPSLKEDAIGSGDVLPLSEQNPLRHRRMLDLSSPQSEHSISAEHAHLLANKWLNANKLAELVKTEGLVYKKGKFSAIEEQQLTAAIENYRVMRGLTKENLQDLIYPQTGNDKDNAFWSEITTAVPLRPIIAVYHHVRRAYHPLKQQGKWTSSEDALLKQAVADLGQQWEKVSKRVGRMSSDCRDRYRNHILGRETRVTGHWTKDEEEELTRIVTDMTVKQGRDIDNDVFWGRVSELMGGKRGRQQCRIKWTDALSKTIKNDGLKPRWSQQDAYVLVHKVDSLNVRDDTEIDWKTIPDSHWNLWSAHTLQRRWLTMKRGIKGYEDMTHQEIMDILRVKKAHLLESSPSPARQRKERKVSNTGVVADGLSFGADKEAGSSNGPGTIEQFR